MGLLKEDGTPKRALRRSAPGWLGGQLASERTGVVRSADAGARAFDVTLTFCITPEAHGVRPHHTSPPRDVDAYADFCAEQVRRYA